MRTSSASVAVSLVLALGVAAAGLVSGAQHDRHARTIKVQTRR